MPSNLTAVVLFFAAQSGGDYYEETQVTGATLRITIEQPVERKKAREIVRWVTTNAENVASVYGRFPGAGANVIVTPVRRNFWQRGDAVQFGQVTRNDGGTVQLFVNPARPISEFYDDWTATHEFSHLMLPLLNRSDRWISEGFATYYQNILLARSGEYSERDAWTRLTQGFERGRRSRPGLSPRDAASQRARGSTMKIYWSGAAIALMADVELRQRSGGKESLDTVLGQLHECCLPARYKWSGQQLFRKLDSFLETPVFMPLYRRYANYDGYPNVEPLLDDLGVVVRNRGVRFNDDADYAALRSTLLARPDSISSSMH